jgi:hypothetical protein
MRRFGYYLLILIGIFSLSVAGGILTRPLFRSGAEGEGGKPYFSSPPPASTEEPRFKTDKIREAGEELSKPPDGSRPPIAAQAPAASPVVSAPAQTLLPSSHSESEKIREAGEQLSKLPDGKIVVNAPKRMKIGDLEEVHANVGLNVPIEILQKYSKPDGQTQQAFVKVSRNMAAVLTGSAFTISATTPEVQQVAEGLPSVWTWTVEAKQAGEQKPEAVLYVLLAQDIHGPRQRISSYVHNIGVSMRELTWGEWLKSRKEEFEGIQTIVLIIFGSITTSIGWIGWMRSRRKQDISPINPNVVT